MEWMLHVAILGAFHYFYRVMVFDYIDSTDGEWFFFLSKKNPSFYIFLLLIGFVMVHALVLGDTYFTALLLFFVLILASSRLRQKQFYLLAGLSLVFIVSVFWQNNIYMLAWLTLF